MPSAPVARRATTRDGIRSEIEVQPHNHKRLCEIADVSHCYSDYKDEEADSELRVRADN